MEFIVSTERLSAPGADFSWDRKGIEIVEVNRPNRQSRRNQGKSDSLDAVEAARAAISGRSCHRGVVSICSTLRMSWATLRSALSGHYRCRHQSHTLAGPSEQAFAATWVKRP
jgi:hypothetical protein